MRGVCLCVPRWHKTSALSPPMCAMLTPRHATLESATWQRGLVSPQHGCMRRHAFPPGGCAWTRLNFTASPRPMCPRWWWRLEDGSMPARPRRRAALPGPPARRHAARHDRPRSVRRLYHSPACRTPQRRRGAHHPLAADRVLDLAATRWWGRAAAFSRRRAPAAVAHVRDAAPRRGRALRRATARVPRRVFAGLSPIRDPRVSRAAAPTPRGTHGSRRAGYGPVVRATKARPAWYSRQWMRRSDGA